MRLSKSFDDYWQECYAGDKEGDTDVNAFRRLATAVGKYWLCKRSANHTYEAMECLGGNGYCEVSTADLIGCLCTILPA